MAAHAPMAVVVWALLASLGSAAPSDKALRNTSAHLLRPLNANIASMLDKDCLSRSTEVTCPTFCSWNGSACFASEDSADDISTDADEDALVRALAAAILTDASGGKVVGDFACSDGGSEVPSNACQVLFKATVMAAWCLRSGLASALQCAVEEVTSWWSDLWKDVGETVGKTLLGTFGGNGLVSIFETMGICSGRAKFLASLIVSGTMDTKDWAVHICGWLMTAGCNKHEEGQIGGQCEDYAENLTISNCSKVSRLSDGNFKFESKDRFKCIFPALTAGNQTCPSEWHVDHDGIRYPCATPEARNWGNQTDCKAWCQNVHPVDECLNISRGSWGKKPGQLKCTFDKGTDGTCKKQKITVGGTIFPCQAAQARKSNTTQCKTWCTDVNMLDLVPNKPPSFNRNCTEVSRSQFNPSEFKCVIAKKWDMESNQAVCPNETVVIHNGVRYPCKPTETRTSNGLACKAWCSNIHPIDGCLTVSRGSWGQKSGKVKCMWEKGTDGVCAKANITVGGKTFPCEVAGERKSNPNLCKTWCADLNSLDLLTDEPYDADSFLENCTDVSRTHDGQRQSYEKDQFKCTYLKKWDTRLKQAVCPAETVVIHDGERYKCEPTETRNTNDLACKAWCDNLPRIDGCVGLERGDKDESRKVKCVFEKVGEACEFGNLTHRGDIFQCDPAEDSSWWGKNSGKCKVWCTDNGKLDLVKARKSKRLPSDLEEEPAGQKFLSSDSPRAFDPLPSTLSALALVMAAGWIGML